MWRQEVLELHVGLMQKQMLTKCCKLYSTLLSLSLLKCVRICHIQARVTTCADNHCLNDLLVVHTWHGIRLPCAGCHQEEDLHSLQVRDSFQQRSSGKSGDLDSSPTATLSKWRIVSTLECLMWQESLPILKSCYFTLGPEISTVY